MAKGTRSIQTLLVFILWGQSMMRLCRISAFQPLRFQQRHPSCRAMVTNLPQQRVISTTQTTTDPRQLHKATRTARHLEIKRLLSNNNSNATTNNTTYTTNTNQLVQVRILVDESLRHDLQLSGREKRGRLFLPPTSDALSSLHGLHKELYGFFRALRKDSFCLKACLPVMDVRGNGTIVSPVSHGADSWNVSNNDDVQRTFARAQDYFERHSDQHNLVRPSIVLLVQKHPLAPEPLSPPPYLQNMPDPTEIANSTMTMLSFYAFPKGGIHRPARFADTLKRLWRPFGVVGRVYVAREGINAQMSVPTNVLSHFQECCTTDLPNEVGVEIAATFNVDPVPLSRCQFATAGTPRADGTPAPPFTNLHVRVRDKVVADGLDNDNNNNCDLDWQRAGYDMPALEWHETIKSEVRARQRGASPSVVILDCRNSYETDVGRFEGAEPLQTDNFRESWEVLKDRLADTPKDAPIMTYCTGGIRCVKVGAYLTQELGFKNVSRLAGGIISYDRNLNQEKPEEESLFKGTNVVFDGRLSRAITDDALGRCVTCGGPAAMVSNCRNSNCHTRIIQCEQCQTSFQGTCSEACRNRLVNGAMAPQRYDLASSSSSGSDDSDNKEEKRVYHNLDDYSTAHSSPIPPIYAEMEQNTKSLIPLGSHMVSGAAQGKLLTQLASMTREGRILEVGTFTGYATACLLQGAANVGEILGSNVPGSRKSGPFVLTLERDIKAYNVAVSQLQCLVEHGFGPAGAKALCDLRDSVKEPPSPPSDQTVLHHQKAGLEVHKVSDALATLEDMAYRSNATNEMGAFDMIFLDADKTRLIEYADACLSSNALLKKGGMIVVDNVLWKGLVLEAAAGDFSSLLHDNDALADVRKNRRARKLANKMHRFNAAIVKDTHRAEVIMMPLRDGLSVIRKK